MAQMTVREYLDGRRRTVEQSIFAETLANNEWKEKCERTALAEITAMEIFMATECCAKCCKEIAPSASNNISWDAMQKIYDIVNDCGYDAETKCHIIRSFFAQRPC